MSPAPSATPFPSPRPEDERFSDPAWREPPWSGIVGAYLAFTHWLEDALYSTKAFDPRQRRLAAFWARQWLDAVAPSNFLHTNPVALRKAIETQGASLASGLQIFLEDLKAGTVRMTDPRDFLVGRNLALTPGAVVFRGPLFELIHYAAVAARTRRVPLLIVTPWINKFYVLDLTPAKSLVAFLLAQGFDVFMVSWKNPDAAMRETTFDDYLVHGIDEAVRIVRRFTGAPQIHCVGYCIGGTLLAIYMAWLNRRYPDPSRVPVAHWTAFATLTDFGAPGDIEAFIDERQVGWLSGLMAARGYLDGGEMAAAFRMLRPNSLIWHYVVHGWLYGEKPPAFDVLYWNMDTTRMPYRMHEYYLRKMYLENKLVKKDALTIAGEPIDLGRIVQPLYCVGAEDDHIAPWKETFRIAAHLRGPTRYVLSSSGHILGIVNPPVSPPKRSFRARDVASGEDAERWHGRAGSRAGSWWEDWIGWLDSRCGARVKARPVTSRHFPRLADAPGTYVLER